jgi:hypothetical protein
MITHVSHGSTYPAILVIDEDGAMIVTVHMRLPDRAAGQIFAVIHDNNGRMYAKPFNYNPAVDNHDIDFTDILPPGFFHPGRSFRLDFREWVNHEPLPTEWILNVAAATVFCVDPVDDDTTAQTIGIPFA